METSGSALEPTLPSLLSAEGKFYNQGTEDAYALSLGPGRDVAVVVDLGEVQKIYSVVIKNRGSSANQVGLTVSCSADGTKWTTRGSWVVKEAAWAWCLSVRHPARYVKLSRPDRNTDKPFELKWVKILTRGSYNDEELMRLRFDGLPVRPAVSRPIPEWMSEGTGLGLFIHWGLNGWGLFRKSEAEHDRFVAEWPKSFTAESYDPDKWMAAARRGGFAYTVITTRHHAGFNLWPSKTESVGGWGVVKHLGGRDLLAPFVLACRKNGIRIGFYFSPIHWMWKTDEFPNRGFPRVNNWDRGAKFVDMPREQLQPILDRWLDQDVFPCVEELLTRYGRIDYAWFDGFNWNRGVGLDFRAERMKKLILKHQPGLLLNPRYNNWGEAPKFGDLATAENHFPQHRPAGPWEFCWCMRGGWFAGGKGADTSNGTPAVNVLAAPAKCRSWGGYCLADIGPFNDGTMPDYYYGLCDVLERWMAKNRRALLGVHGGPWPDKCNVPVTIKDDTWYLFAWPQDEKGEFLSPRNGRNGHYDYTPRQKTVTVARVGKPASVRMLASGRTLDYRHDGSTLTVTIPAAEATPLLDVIEVRW
ncbi:alpha-L-fucosidase [Planctomycetota bacterium]